MPEGVTWSDEHDSDSNDAFKALDIDVTSPLSPKEHLPSYLKHRTVENPLKTVATVEPQEVKKKKKTKEGEPEKRKKKKTSGKGGDDTAVSKEEKKKKKKEKSAQKDSLISMVEEAAEYQPTKILRQVSTTEGLPEKSPAEDVDFWLSQDNTSVKRESDRPKSLELSSKPPKSSSDKERKPKEYKKKKSRSKLRSHSAEEELIDEAPEVVDKSGYEEAFGLAQDENFNESPTTDIPASRFNLLTEDKNLKIEFDSYISDTSAGQIAVNFVFTNKHSDASLKNINFEVVDSVGLVVDKNAGMEMPVKFLQLLPKSNWNMTLIFNLRANSVAAQTVRGTVTYMKLDGNGGSSSEMKDFKLSLSCSAFMLPVQISTDEFALLLESGQLNFSAKKTVELLRKIKFSEMLTKICFLARFYLVEQIDACATLHAMTIKQQRVVVLVKFFQDANASRIILEAKSPEQVLTDNLLAEITEAISAST